MLALLSSCLRKLQVCLPLLDRNAHDVMCHCPESDQYLSLLTPSDVREGHRIECLSCGVLIVSAQAEDAGRKIVGYRQGASSIKHAGGPSWK